MDREERVERLLEAAFMVIDPLPRQVPAGSEGQYFAVEDFWLREPQIGALRRKFCSLLLKLNCYFDLDVLLLGREGFARNPAPEELLSWIADPDSSLNILLPSQDSLITLFSGDVCMTVYHPSDAMLKLLQSLAAAEGLFLWQPPDSPGAADDPIP